ncbi:MAG: ABC transporter permease, partial [Gammaproteobacteria bacterium]|nr:ABC transporter permease [Gammaproteobacteria bacterium]
MNTGTNMSWSIIFRLAWRNLWRNHRRTLIMLSAIALGLWGMIWMTALMRGMVDQMIDSSIKTLSGHIQIHAAEYLDDPSIEHIIPSVSASPALQALLADDEVVAWSERIRVPAVIRSERDVLAITLVGIDPVREQGLSFIGDSLSAGIPLESVNDNKLIVGKKLLERLQTKLNRRVVVMSQDPDNTIAERGFRIAGVFDTDLQSTETSYVFAGLETVRKMLKMGSGVSEISLLGHDYRDLTQLLDKTRAAVISDVEVKTWLEQDPYMASMLGVMDGFVLVWFAVIFLALSFGLVNTLLMAVFERTREIGLVQALGMKPPNILFMVLIESIIMLLIGLLAGNLLSWLTILPLKDGIDVSVVAEGMELAGMSSTL